VNTAMLAQWRNRGAWLAAALVTCALLFMLGRGVVADPRVAVVTAIGLLVLGIVAVEPAAVPLVAMPILLVTSRIGGASVDLTLSDAALTVATVPAILVALGGVSAPMRNALWLGALYQAVTLFTVVQNPYQANLVEWFHAGTLVIGALLVGWAVGRHGFARIGLTLMILMGLLLAVSTLGQAALAYAHGDFSPIYTAWPYQMHKNAVGVICALLAVLVYVHPPWMGWRRGWALLVFWVFVAAMLTTQSRQAIIGLSVGVLVLILRRTPAGRRRRSKGMLLALIPALAGVSVMVRDQIASGNEFNSLFQRVTWFESSIQIWLHEPWFGVGLRWWYTDRFAERFQPPNGLIDTMTAAGVLGLAAFLALLVGTWWIARSIDPVYGTVAEVVLIVRFVQSQFDLFWVSVAVSVPFVVLGVVLGAVARRDAEVVERARLAEALQRALPPAGTRR
jgi:O-antigen ligase